MPKEKAAIKVKKKNWYEIIAPKVFDEIVIGETTVSEPSKLIGKPVLINMMALTNDPKRQNISIKFEINDVKDNKALTKISGYYLSSSSLRRFMRRATSRIDDSLIAETSDNVKVRIKPFLLTRRYVTGSVSTSLRKLARSFIAKQVKKNTYEKLINALVTYKFQRSISMYLKKIYPLRTSEIRAMYMEKEKKKIAEKPKEAKKKEATKEVKEEKPKEKPKEEKKQEVKEEVKKTEVKEGKKEVKLEENSMKIKNFQD